MTQQYIGVGAEPNDGQGTPIRNAFIITNENFSELYARAQVDPPTTLIGSLGDQPGWYAYDSTYFYYCFAHYDGTSVIWAQITQVGNVTVTTIADGTSNVKIADINGNATVSVNGFSNVVVVAPTGQYVRGVVSALGNVTGSYLLGNGSQLTGLNPLYNNSNVTQLLATLGGNNISSTANITSANINASTAINSSGNISATGNITTGGFFVGNFIGNVVATLTNIPGPGGAVVYNDGSGNAAATAGLIFDVTGPNTLTVQGAVVTNGTVSAAGNILASGQVSAGGNVTGGNFNTTGVLSAAGNVRGSNLNTVGLVTASGNIIGSNIVTAGVVSASGNVSGNYLRATLDINAGGNVSATTHTGTTVSVTGNVTAGNIITSGFNASNISVSGNVTSNNITTGNNITVGAGLLAQGAYTGPYPDGVVVDYVTGNGRISTSAGDGLQFYNQGLANTWLGGFTANGAFSATGNVTGANVTLSDTGLLRIGNLVITDATIDSTEHQITIGSTGNVGNIIIAGNLQVLGNTTTINSNTITTNDLTINLANNAINSAAADGGGIGVGPAGSEYITWTYNNTANTWNTAGGISATGNITGGNLSVGTGLITLGGIVNANGNATGNIGSSTKYFNTVFAKATSAQYADLAENYQTDADYAPGTVVIFGGNKEITVSTDVADERVAGAISTEPAHLMNAEMAGLPVALRGRIPVNVIGPVTKGDSLVTSPTAGYAQSVGRSRLYGQAVFAKALETNLEDGEKLIIAVIL